jgi:predicted dehydrogenase
LAPSYDLPSPEIGLAGCGRWGSHILRDLLDLRATVHVADPDPGARAHALAAGAASAVTHPDALPDVMGAIVASPALTHAAVVADLLPRGRPLFVEKPLTTDVASAQHLAASGRGLVSVMDKWRYHPGVEALGAIARSGELGPVVGCRSTRAGWGGPAHDVDAVWTLLPHELSIAFELLGTLPAARHAHAERLEGSAAGMVAVLGVSPWHVIEISLRHPTYRREVRLHCAGGVAVMTDPYADHIEVVVGAGLEASKPAREQRLVGTEPPLRRALAAFLAHLAGGPPPRSSVAEGAAVVLRVTELRALCGL